MWPQPEEKPGLTHPPTGMHTRGQLTVFKAFFGLGTGTPSKATDQQQFVTRPARTAGVGSLRRRIGRWSWSPTLLNLGSFTLRWSASTQVAGKPSREPGHWLSLECSCIRGVAFPGLESKPNTNRCHSPPVSELRRSVSRRRCDFDGSTRWGGEKDQGQLRSNPIHSTSPGGCHGAGDSIAPLAPQTADAGGPPAASQPNCRDIRLDIRLLRGRTLQPSLPGR